MMNVDRGVGIAVQHQSAVRAVMLTLRERVRNPDSPPEPSLAGAARVNRGRLPPRGCTLYRSSNSCSCQPASWMTRSARPSAGHAGPATPGVPLAERTIALTTANACGCGAVGFSLDTTMR
jgi:hypothetical protein